MEEFVTDELAVKLEEKGFDWETREVYERNTLACRYEDYPKPTISQVMKWLREEKKIHISIDISDVSNNAKVSKFMYSFYITNLSNHDRDSTLERFNSYEEAVLAGIEYVLEYLI